MIKIGIIGAGGYAGQTLVSLLLLHPETKVAWLVSEDAHKGKKISELYPHLKNICDIECETLSDLDGLIKEIDFVFLALPHGIAINYVPKIIKAGKKVVDLSADYRFSDEASFGLPELYKEDIKKARLIGNPGCYPTASILGLAPLVKNNLVDTNTLIVDAKSGISGAGRGVSQKIHFCERNEGITAYSVVNHRHMEEIEYQVTRISGDRDIRVTFVPHLMPIDRGILATCYAKIKTQDTRNKIQTKELIDIYKSFYRDAPFVRIYETGEPCTKNVSGTNYCDIGIAVNEATNTVIVMSAIDNLVKGAAGQAVQNMNIMMGYPEKAGLEGIALFP